MFHPQTELFKVQIIGNLSSTFLHCYTFENNDVKNDTLWLQIGRETLEEEFTKMLDRDKENKERDQMFDKLKSAVKEESMHKHEWDEKAEESLVCNMIIGCYL